MAILGAGITGHAAGTIAGVQVYKARTARGNVTAIREAPAPPAERSANQILYQQRMVLIRQFLDTTSNTFSAAVRRMQGPPYRWSNDWLKIISTSLNVPPPGFTFATNARRMGSPTVIAPSAFRLVRVSSTALTLSWSYLPLGKGQSPSDRLYMFLFSASLPYDRTSAKYRIIAGSQFRSSSSYAMSGFTTNHASLAFVFFADTATNFTRREPFQLIPIS